MSILKVAICKEGLSEGWLGGLNYFRNLLEVFDAARGDSIELHFFTDDLTWLADMRLSPRIVLHRLPMMQRKTLRWAVRRALQAILGRDVLLIRELRRHGVQSVVFSEVVGAKGTGIRCFPWIPDFQFKHHPDLFPAATVAAEQHRATRCIAGADGLVVSSNSARDDAVTLFGAAPSRVHVLHFAPKMDFAKLSAEQLRDEVFQKYGIDRPYFFLPNQYWHHKNHKLVLHALSLMKVSGQVLPLVISTGMTVDLRDPRHFPDFEAHLEALELQGAYRILGVIPRLDMLVLLAHSMALINPSRFEGWSTTVEEGKALGKSLLISSINVHREQVAQTPDAKLFDPDDSSKLAELMGAKQATAAGAVDYPPRPRPELYSGFSVEYIALLKSTAQSENFS